MNLTKAKWFIETLLTKWKYGSMGNHSYIGRTLFVQHSKKLFIGHNVRIYQNFHVVSYDKKLRIGSNTTISGNVFVSNVDHDYHALNIHSLDQQMIEKETVIGEYCFIGYGAVILPGTKLGKQCIVGANSVVKGSFPDYCVIAGNPAKIIRIYNMQTKVWERCSDE